MFNSTLGFSSSLDIFRNEFSRLDSIEPNSSLVLISDSSSMVFLHLVKSIFPKDFSFRVNKFRSIEMNEVEFSSCKSFLRAHQDRLEFVFDSIATSLDVAKQYKRFPVHSFQISAIHFLDKNAGKQIETQVETACRQKAEEIYETIRSLDKNLQNRLGNNSQTKTLSDL